MNGTETETFYHEIDLKDNITAYFTTMGVITVDSDMSEMCFKLKNKSSALSEQQIIFEAHFRGRFFTITIDIPTDIFEAFAQDLRFTINDVVGIDFSFFEKSMGKLILKAQTVKPI